jgi:erythronate-4-phosphate dehydrogenase
MKEDLKIKIVADNKIPFLKGVLDQVADMVYLPGGDISTSDVREADALITRTRTCCDASLLDGSGVKFIATATIGFDHIDTEYCERKGIGWTNAPGCNSCSVEQYILSVLLNIASQEGFDLSSKTLGIVGVGHVGSKVEKIARVLGMQVLLNDPPRARAEGPHSFVDLAQILQEADIITLHVPLNLSGEDKTYHLAGNDFFRHVAKKGVFINSSRGGVVDSGALKAALMNHKLAGAVLDVWEGEPGIDLEFLDMARIATTHIAGYSTDGKAKGTSMSVQAISRFFGLGFDDWYPDKLPGPEHPEITLDGTGLDRQEMLLDVVNRSYNVMEDDRRLRESPERFEELRGSYPIRREAGAFRVKIINDQAGAGAILEKLGYQVIIKRTDNN